MYNSSFFIVGMMLYLESDSKYPNILLVNPFFILRLYRILGLNAAQSRKTLNASIRLVRKSNIISREDCTRHPDAKMSPCLKRVVTTFSGSDTYRSLFPDNQCFFFYHKDMYGGGATRIDRSYSYGDLAPSEAKYVSVAFSDHLSYIVTLQIPNQQLTLISPKARSFSKTTPMIVKDKQFQARKEWEEEMKSFRKESVLIFQQN